MKVLLCIPVIKGSYQASPDLGLGYLAKALLKHGHDVAILDSVNLDLDHEGFRKAVADAMPDVLGIKVFSRDVMSTRECLKLVKGLDKGIVTLIGGPHPSTAGPEECMGYFKDADYAFSGEADEGLPLLLDRLTKGGAAGSALDDVPGLIFRRDGNVVSNTKRYIQDLDSIGRPAWELMDPRGYSSKESLGFYSGRLPAADIMATRGCPFECSFCASHLITGRKVRFRSVGNVIEEIKYLKESFGIKTLNVVDDNIAINRKYMLEFCQALMDERIDLEWHCPYGVRLDCLDEEVVRRMEQSGCRSMSVGIESGSNDVLRHMRKKLTVEQIEDRLRMIKKNSNIRIIGNFILGYPTDTVETVNQTIRFARRLPIDAASFTPFRLTPGTPIFRELMARGEVSEVMWDGISVDDIFYSPPSMSKDDLKRLWKKSYAVFYSQPRIIWGLLKSMSSVTQLKWLARRVLKRLVVS